MGMFDYLRCDRDTPDGWKPANGLFQTKDLDCELTVYRITEDGRLLENRTVGYEDVPESEWQHVGAAPGSIEALWHEASKKRPIRQEVELPWHGFIRFYDLEKLEGLPPGPVRGDVLGRFSVWHEYRAKFTDGRLVELTAVPQEGV
jgi:hypothetical protein